MWKENAATIPCFSRNWKESLRAARSAGRFLDSLDWRELAPGWFEATAERHGPAAVDSWLLVADPLANAWNVAVFNDRLKAWCRKEHLVYTESEVWDVAVPVPASGAPVPRIVGGVDVGIVPLTDFVFETVGHSGDPGFVSGVLAGLGLPGVAEILGSPEPGLAEIDDWEAVSARAEAVLDELPAPSLDPFDEPGRAAWAIGSIVRFSRIALLNGPSLYRLRVPCPGCFWKWNLWARSHWCR